jgi:hypothetical protein
MQVPINYHFYSQLLDAPESPSSPYNEQKFQKAQNGNSPPYVDHAAQRLEKEYKDISDEEDSFSDASSGKLPSSDTREVGDNPCFPLLRSYLEILSLSPSSISLASETGDAGPNKLSFLLSVICPSPENSDTCIEDVSQRDTTGQSPHSSTEKMFDEVSEEGVIRNWRSRSH